MNKQTLFYLSCCLFLLLCDSPLKAQVNSDTTLNTYPVDTQRMQTVTLTPAETAQIRRTASHPIWSLIAPVLNLGAYYSYISPTGSFKQKVSTASAFSFDIGLDLSRIFGQAESDWHIYTGFNGDFASFGKSNNKYSYSVGDTSYTTTIKNSLDAGSFYLQLEYRRFFVCPFVSAAYTISYLNPYKETEIKIVNKTTNYSTVDGDYLSDEKSRGINITGGLNWKFRTKNGHTQLMFVTRMSYVKTSAVKMLDIESVQFSNNGTATYTTSMVHPSFLMYSAGLKLNF